MSCLKVYGLKNRPVKSNLLKDLKHKHGEERGNYLYEIVFSDSTLDSSFINWWQRQDDPIITRDGEPSSEMVDEWLVYVDRKNQLSKTFQNNDFRMSIEEFNEISEGLAYYVTNTLFDKENMTPDDLMTTNHSKVRNVLNVALDKVMSNIAENRSHYENGGFIELDRVDEITRNINKDRKGFYRAFNNFLKSKLKLEFNLDSVLSDDIETKDDKVTKDSAFNKNSIEFDTKDGAPEAIKILIASLPKLAKDGTIEPSSVLGLPTLVNYNSTFNFIQQHLIEIPGNIDLMIAKLEELVSVKPELKFLIKKLKFKKDTYTLPSTDYALLKETKLRTEFVNQFNKSKLQFALHIKDKNGNIKIIDSNIDKLRDSVLKAWEGDFKIKIDENPSMVENSAWLKVATPKQVLEFLGINIPASKVDTAIIQAIKDYGLSEDNDIANIFDPKNEAGVKNRLLQLADIYAKETDDVIDFQQYNAEGKLIYSITLNNYLTSLAKELSFYAGTDELLDIFPEIFNNNYSQHSKLLDRILQGEKIKIGIYDGIVSDVNKNNGKPTKDLKEKDLYLQRILGILKEGQFTLLRSADRGIENYMYFEGSKELFVNSVSEAKDYYKMHLADEIATIKNDDPDIVHFEKNNKSLRVFGYTDSKGRPHLLTDKLSMKTILSDDFSLDNPSLSTFLDDMITNMVANEREMMSSYGVYQEVGGKYVYLDGLIEEYGDLSVIENLFTLNSHIANIEYTKVFSGDLAFFKNPADIFKRMSMLNSTKESLRTDPEMNLIMDKLSHEFELQNDYLDDYDTSKIKTITIREIESSMDKDFSDQEKDSLKKAFGENTQYYDAYKYMEEADGFAYITLDEYRRMGIRAAEWTAKDESLYQNIASGNIDYNSENIHRFTMKKYQYTGKVTDSNINIPAGRKFAFMPLVPGLITKGSILDKLNTEMLKNGVGMAFYESAAKFGHVGRDGAYHQMYDSNGDFNIKLGDENKYDILDYKYMGNQLKIHAKPKSKIQGTQRNKLIKQNLFENGAVIENESGLEELLNKYDDLQATRINRAFMMLKKRFGIDENISHLNVHDLDKFINVVIDQGLQQGFSTNDLIALDMLREIPAFDILPNKQKIESLITSSLKNNVIDNKRKGDAYAQASDVGFELKVNKETEERANRHNLKFYRYAYNEDGTLSDRLLPMEIMIPLPTGLIEYVIKNHGNGKVITQQALDAFNSQLAEDAIVYEKTGVKTDLITLATYSGFRIPTQDASSMEVAQVKKFFMPYMTGMVVVPKAIVVKTGSDFDIDKLSMYSSHYFTNSADDTSIAKKFINDKNLTRNVMRGIMYKEIGIIVDTNVTERFIKEILSVPERDINAEAVKMLNLAYKNALRTHSDRMLEIQIPKAAKNVAIEDMTKAEIDNELLQVEIELALVKENHGRLLAPLDGTIIKDIVDTIRKNMGWSSAQIKDGAKDYLHEVFTNKKNIEKFIAFLSGKSGVGQVAVHITNHVLAQQAGLEMKSMHNYFGLGKASINEVLDNTKIKKGTIVYDKNGTKFTFKGLREENSLGARSPRLETTNVDGNKEILIPGEFIKLYSNNPKLESSEDSYIPLGRVKNDSKQYISEVLSALITAYVDIAKDPYILDINAVNATANTILMMTRWGMKSEEIFLFINQPIIKEYLKARSIEEAVTSDKSTGKKSKSETIDEVLRKFDSNKSSGNFIYKIEEDIEEGKKSISERPAQGVYSDFTLTELRKGLQDYSNNGKFDSALQTKSLDLFLEYQRQSKTFQLMIRSTSPDTQQFKNISILKSQVQAREEVVESKMFKNYDKMFMSFIGESFDAKEAYFEMIKDLFIAQDNRYVKSLDALKEVAMATTINTNEKQSISNKIENGLVNFILASDMENRFDHGKIFNEMFKGNKSLPKQIKKIQKAYKDEGLMPNFLIKELLPMINDKRQGFDSMKFRSSKLTNEETEQLVYDFNNINNPEYDAWFSSILGYKVENFAENIWLYNMVQSGIDNSPLSLNRAIPATVHFNRLYRAVSKAIKPNMTSRESDFIDIEKYTGYDVNGNYTGVGEFMLNNAGIFYGKPNDNYSVKWSSVSEDFVISDKKNFNVYKPIGKYNHRIYNTTTKAIIEKTEDKFKAKDDFSGFQAFDLDSTQIYNIDPTLEKNITKFMKDLGVDIKLVDNIRDRTGKLTNAVGKASLANNVIELTQGRRAETLPEEAAHMITAMLGQNHPIIKQMMSDIVNYEVYDKVKRDYKDVYTTEQEFRFEAVGKLIGEHIIKQNPLSQDQRTKVENWFQRLISTLRRWLSKTDTTIPKKTLDSFEMMAKNIVSYKGQLILKADIPSSPMRKMEVVVDLGLKYGMNEKGYMPKTINVDELNKDLILSGITKMDVAKNKKGEYYFKEYGSRINPLVEHYDLAEGSTQAESKQKFLDTKKRLVGNIDTAEAKMRYQLRDKILGKRVSDAQKVLFEKNKTQAEIDEIQNTEKSIIARETGTILHDFNEDLVNYIISNNRYANLEIGDASKVNNKKPPKPSMITESQEIEIYKSIDSLMKGISQQQSSIDKNGKVMLFTENFVVDDKEDVGGSQDLTVVYSDGSASIYDYKFINFNKQKINGKSVYSDHLEIDFMKEKSYSMQLTEYKRILKDIYGITKIRATRILPFNIQFKYVNRKITPTVQSIEGFKMSKNYLMPLPVANELTQDENINKILSSLFKQQEKSILTMQRNYGDKKIFERVKVELASIKRSIKYIQLTNDFAPLFESINITLDNEANMLKDLTVDSFEDLIRMKGEIDTFQGLYKYVLIHAKNKNLSDDLDKMARRLADAKIAIEQKLNELLLELNPDISTPQKEIDGFKEWLGYLSEIDHPAFEMANDYFKKANGNVQRAIETLNKDLTVKTDGLRKWASSQGITLTEAFRKIKTDKNKLINKLSEEFYKEKIEQSREGNAKWFKDRYSITKEGAARYKVDLANQEKLIISRFSKESALYKKMMEDWKNHNDLANRDSAWTDKWALWKYGELKNESNYYSDEYKNLMSPSNKELLEYYEFYTKTNKHLNSLIGEKIEANFIANIKKDFVEVLAMSGNPAKAFSQLRKDFVDQFRVQYDGEDTITEDGKIPLLYYNNFLIKDKESGKWVVDETAKSEDLSSILLLFAQSVHKKNQLTNIKNVMEALKIHIADQAVIKTENFGRVKLDKFTGEMEMDEESTKNSDLFDVHMRALLYGESLQNEDSVLLDKYSSNKAISSAMKLFSANTLALSYVSAFGNVASGFANTFIKSAGGRYYKPKHLRKAMGLRMSRGGKDKYNHMTEYFKIENENWGMKMANKLSASTLTKNVTFDKLFTLWQKGDEFIANTVLVSMSQNYGVHPETQTLKRMDELPEGSKSIFEMFEVKNDNITSGLTDAQFDDFRRKVVYISRRVKGSNTTEELSKIQTTVWGKSLMFFKNWIGPMLSERFGGIKYTKDLGEYEYGRYRSLMKDVLNKNILQKLSKLTLDLLTLGTIKYKGNVKMLEAQFDEFMKLNPQLKGKMTVEEYVALRERSIRESLFELRILTALSLLILAAGMDWDDDGEKDYNKNIVTRQSFKFLKRTYLELSFFSNPASVTELVRNPLPIISVGVNAINILTNTVDELGDLITNPNEVDKTPIGHYTKKASIAKPVFMFLEDMVKDEDTE